MLRAFEGWSCQESAKNGPVRMGAVAQLLDDEAREMAGVAGLEPVTSAVTGQRSNQLSYTPANGEPETRGPSRPSQR